MARSEEKLQERYNAIVGQDKNPPEGGFISWCRTDRIYLNSLKY